MENDLIKRAQMWRVGLFLGDMALVLLCVWSLPSVVADSIRSWPWHGTEMLVWPMWGIVTTILMLPALASVADEIFDVAIRIAICISRRRHQR
ncbi:hypothetical protein [Burkholderia cenocepacia]|uniref:hypothetical protein n=1 Tax=Burkholderia cenocepacia TaxID=95486 RepID=UPI000F5C0061|nr:hypothetical protein [Burkholderia cenocepacia]